MQKYIGQQNGFSPAGGSIDPLLVYMADDGMATSPSPLIRAATKGLDLHVDFRPKPIYFLTDITADVTGAGSIVPPFYTCNVHLRVINPLPQTVVVKKISLTAYHLNLTGPILYHYNREWPGDDLPQYTMDSKEALTLDFSLNVLQEVNWGFLFSPSEIWALIGEAASKKIEVGISLKLTIKIEGGYMQEVQYDNNALQGQLCFHVVQPSENCGGLPKNPHVPNLVGTEATIVPTISSSEMRIAASPAAPPELPRLEMGSLAAPTRLPTLPSPDKHKEVAPAASQGLPSSTSLNVTLV